MKNVLKTALVLIVIVAVFCAAMYALNIYTGPIIEAKTTGAAKERLNVVMPDGAGYRDITKDLGELPESVVKVHEEIGGLGYVVEAKASSKYTGNEPMDILIAVDMDGKICGIKLVSHTESLIFDAAYPDTYLGKDSALSGVELFAGSTFSSTAFKTAVEEAMGVLIANDLIKAGVKTPDQILTELLPTVAPDLANAQKSAGKGDVITAFKAGSAAAYIVAEGDTAYLVVVAADGTSKVYDVSGADVTASKSDAVAKAMAYAASAANERLNEVLPGAAGFEDITSTLTNLPASVLKVHKEIGGLGFAIEVAATGYNTAAPMDVVIGVDAQGKIVEVKIFAYNDTPSFDITKKDPTYLDSYKGQDSTLAGVGLVAGSTISSTGLKTAVSEAMNVLVENELVKAGVKSDEQILTEMIPTVAEGYNKLVDVAATGNIVKAFKFETGTGFAFVVKAGEAHYLAVVNAMGVCKVFDVEGNDVTEAQAAIVAEAKTAAASQKSYEADLTKKLEKMMEGLTDITSIQLDTFNTVASAVSFTVDGTLYYGFYSRSYGFHQMDVYFILDENGAIAKMDAKQFIFEEEYFGNFGGMNTNEYKDGFAGFTGDTWTGDAAIIATATMTSNAMKQSTADVFAAFNSITGGGK